MAELSVTTMDKVLRDAGAKRVSKKAAKAFGNEIEKMALELSEKAAALAEHANRKTVLPEDIRLAKKP